MGLLGRLLVPELAPAILTQVSSLLIRLFSVHAPAKFPWTLILPPLRLEVAHCSRRCRHGALGVQAIPP